MKLRTAAGAIWLAACVAPIPKPAAASGIAAAAMAIEAPGAAEVRAACRGPSRNGIQTGLPANPADDIRCQTIASLNVRCTFLAVGTAIFRRDVRSGQYSSFSQIRSREDSEPHGYDFSALELAESLPPDLHGGALVRAVYAQCMSVVR